jgi:hypothetical protein
VQVILVFILLGRRLAVTGGSLFTDLATAAVGRFSRRCRQDPSRPEARE